MYITVGTWNTDKGEIEPGTEVSAKDLGLKEGDCQRYVELGTLMEKPKAVKPAADSKPEA